MNLRHVTGRGVWGRLVMITLVAVALLAAPADAAPFQLLKTFDSELVGSATFEFTIETKVFGIWVEIPCIDEQGSCSLTFSNVAAGSSFVLADSDDPWFSGGEFYIKEVAPPGWAFGVGTSGASSVSVDAVNKEVYFTFAPASQGYVSLINSQQVPEPTTVGMLGMGLAAALGTRRLRRR
jgi:hypothetical protein